MALSTLALGCGADEPTAASVVTVAADTTVPATVPDASTAPATAATTTAPVLTPSPVSVRPVLGCGEASLTADADIVQVDPARQLDCALGPPIADPALAANAEAMLDPMGDWSVLVSIAP